MKFVISLSVFYFLVIINVSAQNDTIKLKEITVADSIKKETTLSMRSQSELFESCARCHTIGKGRLIGPDLAGIKEKHSEEWLIKFIQASDLVIASGDTAALRLFKENENLPMPRHDYSKDEVLSLVDYITFETKKLDADPNFLDNDFNNAPTSTSWVFILGILLILIPLIDLAFTRLLKIRLINVMLIFVGFAISGKAINEEATYLGRSQGFEPDQPIKFSHRIHAGDNKIDCNYCHTSSFESRHSSIPSANLCLNCHNVIRYGTNTGEEEINKIHKAFESKEPIQWVKVHSLPDHVFFSHAQHVNVGKLDCNKCHGEVEKMGRIQQVNDLSMGWCINCHKTEKVQFDNKYYSSYKHHEDIKSGKIKEVTVDDVGGTNCSKCHY
ncbi:MAG: c-type cytochrome [Bacteroidetes bacterium]|nr:c-type cytochrome [Bacteroidota bacterium]MBT7142085.1 c-type cytochrome [Bacteroidota bacterium]